MKKVVVTAEKVYEILDTNNYQQLRGGSLTEVLLHGNLIIKVYRGPHIRGFEKLQKEVDFINKLPQHLRSSYPEILCVIDRAPILYAYIIPFYSSMKSISQEMMSHTDIEFIWQKVREVSDFMDKTHYPSFSCAATIDYIDETIHHRIRQSQEVFKMFPELKKIISGGLKVNDIELLPLNVIQSSLREDKFTNTKIMPKKLEYFHGNFHMDNILINDSGFLLIDPRGDVAGSKLYDVCKMFVHLLVRYDEIHTDRFLISEEGDAINITLTDSRMKERYDYIQKQYLKIIISNMNLGQPDSTMLVMGGVHAVSFSSYHLRKTSPSIDRVKAYLVAGMGLLTAYINHKKTNLEQSFYGYK